MMDRVFYVYEHLRGDTGEVFYIGKGAGRRAWRTQERNAWHRRVADKHGLTVRLARDNLSEPCALSLERVLIFVRREQGKRLANLTDGGEGSSGYKPTPETLERMALAQLGKKRSPETRAKQATAATGRRHTPEARAKIRARRAEQVITEETRQKLSEIGKSAEGRAKLACAHDTWRGARHTDESIQKMREKVKASWDSEKGDARRVAVSRGVSKPVQCLDTGCVYPNMLAAAQALGTSLPRISTACKTGGRVRGFRFVKVESET